MRASLIILVLVSIVGCVEPEVKNREVYTFHSGELINHKLISPDIPYGIVLGYQHNYTGGKLVEIRTRNGQILYCHEFELEHYEQR